MGVPGSISKGAGTNFRRASSQNCSDVKPQGEILVVVCSDRVPYEVLYIRTERMTVVGWFLAELNSTPRTSSNTSNRNGFDLGIDLKSEMAAIKAELAKVEAAVQEAIAKIQLKADRLKHLQNRQSAVKRS